MCNKNTITQLFVFFFPLNEFSSVCYRIATYCKITFSGYYSCNRVRLPVTGVIVLTALANQFRLHKLDKVEKFVMSYGGLRGAVAFALVLLIDPRYVPLKPMFVTTTIAVIYFTVFIQVGSRLYIYHA